jgi:AraC-like DNA-binding protein
MYQTKIINNVSSITFAVLPPIEALRSDVENFRIVEYAGTEELAIKVCPNGLPGIVFQHSNGQSAIKSIVTNSGRVINVPTLYLYGQVTELAVMNFKSEPYTTVQAVLKPHALKALFGIDASTVTNGSMDHHHFASEDLNTQLIKAKSSKECVTLLTNFLLAKLNRAQPRDTLVEESLRFIHANISSINVNYLLEHLHISERQFEKRFVQNVGVSPQFYIRVKRFNEAIKLMDTGQYERLSDVAHALNFYDQSHFIRDIKVFSGITPKSISQKVNNFHHDQIGFSYLV